MLSTENLTNIFIACFGIVIVFGTMVLTKFLRPQNKKIKSIVVPTSSNLTKSNINVTSVNYHFTRKCNYKCGFCFHTNINDKILDIPDAKRGLQKLKDCGLKKLNFAGGEPFLYPKFLGEVMKFCKEELNLECVSIVSNGSKIKESWLKKYSKYLDILAVSCDSFNEETNKKIGRSSGEKSNHVENVLQIKDWCIKYGIKFKINTVINRLNYKEDMRKELNELNPSRWKVFQVLIIEGENNGKENGAIRNGQDFIISKNEFNDFLELHKDCPGFVSEDNDQMKTSYLLLDEEMRFLDCSNNKKTPSKSILEYSVEEAYNDSGFNETLFYERGGEYDWCKGESLVKDIEDL